MLLTEEQRHIRDVARRFAERKLAPLASGRDHGGKICRDWIAEIGLPEALSDSARGNRAGCRITGNAAAGPGGFPG